LKGALHHRVFPDRDAAIAAWSGDLDNVGRRDVIKELGRKFREEAWRDFHD
jgi:hypothetical protein